MARKTIILPTAIAMAVLLLCLLAGCTGGRGNAGGQQQQASQEESSASRISTKPTEPSAASGEATECSTTSANATEASTGGEDANSACKPHGEQPNGKIAFVAEDYPGEERPADTDIYVMNADGSERTRLTDSELMEDGPVWSPDGKKIAFVRGEGDLATGILLESSDTYVMNADGTALTKLADDTGGSIAWSPDGKQMVFSPGGDIYVMNADGTDRTRLVANIGASSSFDWSPDGKKIAFSTAVDPGTAPGIYVMNANGSNLSRLRPTELTPGVYSGSYYSPAWSPDGKQIAYVKEDEEGIDTIYVMDIADDTAEIQVTNYENGETGDALSSPTWSPDGKQIAFVSSGSAKDDDGNWVYTDDIYVADADGFGTPTNLVNTPEAERRPAWAPGG